MKRILIIAALLLLAASLALGGTYTTSGLLYKPASGETGYASSVNNNFDVLDELVRTPMGQVRLVKSGANLVLQPFQGNRLMINGINRTVASAGVSLAPTSLSANTTYYIYAYWTGSAVALEASTTTHATSTTTGVEQKSGDATRSLVGMARTITGPAWSDTITQRFVISWFNRRDLPTLNNFTATRSTTSATYVEVNTEIRNEFLTWGDDAVRMFAAGVTYNNTNGANVLTTLGIDSATPEDVYVQNNNQSADLVIAQMSLAYSKVLAEGYHYVTIVGAVYGGGTANWFVLANQAGARTTLSTIIRG